MKVVAVVLDLGAFVAGLLAARYWWRASRVDVVNPSYDPHTGVAPNPDYEQMGWTVGTLQAIAEAGRLNAIAAKLTAAAVLLGTVGNLVGVLGCW
ncbi:MAG TPA: hypothetical protein VNL71_20465 [Chloroflexota bacterium]|nr:hypothetical protein [Chloroflexota bacterium]